ncbi:hypothetical protein E3N88_24874 [Mikania micrantha]|uniref:Glucose/ribitol dehydrogenase n=1 Tax=Mikania micrantha TaxID=192012 RepID=A0A5N6N4I0_9ASTR|nr:hypothetical protein E3N88_24874 [Mikania micrantha]
MRDWDCFSRSAFLAGSYFDHRLSKKDLSIHVLKDFSIMLDNQNTNCKVIGRDNVDINTSSFERIAVVTGGKRGIGFEICKQLLASSARDLAVVITAKDEQKGLESLDKLKTLGYSENVNNAGVNGIIVNEKNLNIKADEVTGVKAYMTKQIMLQTYETAKDCIETNYYGTKHVTEALLPFLQLSPSPRIVNISTGISKLQNVKDERIKKMLSNVNGLTEEVLEEVVTGFLGDAKDNLLEEKGWDEPFSAYIVSKAVINAYTRILARKYPSFRINTVNPGFTKTAMTHYQGIYTPDEAAKGPVRLALIPDEVTARDELKGLQALHKLKILCSSENLIFHQLDVTDPASIESLADFIGTQFGKLDILVNNAGITGIVVDEGSSATGLALQPGEDTGVKTYMSKQVMIQTYETSKNCIQTNYYGTKLVTEALLPFLRLSSSPRIVNVSSGVGKLENIKDEKASQMLSDVDRLTEEVVDEVVTGFLRDVKDAVVNAYTRILANKYPSFRVNAVNPGFTKTDMTLHKGIYTVEEGARGPVWLALMADEGLSGRFFFQMKETTF